jgi:hypothetical protein
MAAVEMSTRATPAASHQTMLMDADLPDVIDSLPDGLRYRIRYQNSLEIFPTLRGLLA